MQTAYSGEFRLAMAGTVSTELKIEDECFKEKEMKPELANPFFLVV